MNYFFYVLDFLAILFIAFICVLFQSTLLHQGFGIYKPNLILILITYLALNRYAIEGGILSFLFGHMMEVNSGSPQGLYTGVMVLTFYSTKLLSESLFINNIISQMLLVAMTSVISKCFLLLTLSMYQSLDELTHQVLVSLFPMVLLNFLLTPIVFIILKSIDIFFNKARPSKTGSKESSVELFMT